MPNPSPARAVQRLIPALAALLAGWLAWRALRDRRAGPTSATAAAPGPAHDNPADRRALAREAGRMADA